MSKQSQKAEAGALAVQSERDSHVHVQTGLTTEQMSEVMGALANQLPKFATIAKEAAEARFKEFEAKILERFAMMDSANSEKFKDPDFQYVLMQGQHAYARHGDPQIADVIVDLIAERSRRPNRDRLAITLNDAVSSVAELTPNEFAELSLAFLLRYTINHGLSNPDRFCAYIRTYVSPLLPDISREHSSYNHLIAKQCATIAAGSFRLQKILNANYGGLFQKGFSAEELEGVLPDGQKDLFDDTGLITPCMHDPSLLQFRAYNHEKLQEAVTALGIDESHKNAPGGLFNSKLMNDEEMRDALRPDLPEFDLLHELWHETPLKHLQLTTLGQAIGHSNLRHVSGWDADLSIWIK